MNTIIKLSQFQENFNTTFEKANDKRIAYDYEIKEVIDYVNSFSENIPRRSFKQMAKSTGGEFNSIGVKNSKAAFKVLLKTSSNSIFSEAFNNYLLFGNYTPERLHLDTDEMYKIKAERVKQAYEFSEYYKWLKELQSTPQKTEKKDSLSHKERMLALYYLGLDFKKFNNDLQSARILSKILNLDESNTKRHLTYFDYPDRNNSKVKTEENIRTVMELFEHKDFKEIHTRIKKDLEKETSNLRLPQ